MKPFTIQKTNFRSMSIDSLKFILNEGKDYLDYTIKESEKITNRAYSIVIFLFAILSGVASYTFNKMALGNHDKIVYLNFCLIVFFVILLYHLGSLVFPRTIMANGRIPKTIALPEFLIIPKIDKEENYVLFIIQDIENLQVKIDYNLVKNQNRQEKLKIVMISISVMFPLYLIIAFFTTI